jgi:tetratricopeptide (TPR) repeat protein
MLTQEKILKLIGRSGELLAKEDFTGAIRILDVVIKSFPKDPIYNMRGWALLGAEYNFDAYLDFCSAIKLNPKFANGYFGRALANRELAEFEECTKDLHKALQIAAMYPKENRDFNPRDLDAHFKYSDMISKSTVKPIYNSKPPRALLPYLEEE